MNRGAKVVIHMNGTSTYIKDPVMTDAEPKKFSFDYSYWSHDGYSEDDSGYLCADTPRYADQVFPQHTLCMRKHYGPV